MTDDCALLLAADRLAEVADWHVAECIDMHGELADEDGPRDGCFADNRPCFHARAAYRIMDATRLLRESAGTADGRGSDWFSGYQDAIERADAAEARLSALTDAIDALDIPRTLKIRPAGLAAAVQPPDPEGTK